MKKRIQKDGIVKLVVAVVFTVVFVGSLLLMSFVFTPTNNYPDSGMIDWGARAISAEPTDSVDAIFLGNSEACYGYCPLRIWEDQGIAAYNCGGIGHPLHFSEDFLRDALKTQSPKIVFLETDSIFKKKLLIWRVVSTKMLSTFSVLTYHNRWKNMDASEIGAADHFTYTDVLKGYRFTSESVPADPSTHMLPSSKAQSVFYRNRDYVKRIKAYCEEHGAKLVLVSTPSNSNWNMQKHNGIVKLAEEIDVEYIDLNVLLDEIQLDWETDFYDGGDHLNYRGAEKVSAYLGEYLAGTGLFVDHRADERYASWNDALEEYNQMKAEG